MSNKALSVSRIFSSPDFVDEGFDRPRWSKNGNFYTTLRRVVGPGASALSSNGNSDLTSTTGSASGGMNTEVHEIMWHCASTGAESTLVSYQHLTPAGQHAPLAVDDYTVADDCSKVLIFTKSMKVWRLKTKGSYWILDLKAAASGSLDSLKQLGVGLDPTMPDNTAVELKFASFSPDLQSVAYVFNNNIYVEDSDHRITQLTEDGSDIIINGNFDWVYEEEFGMYCGFRWSPDSKSIAYWQIDQTLVNVVNLVNNTDSLYPKLTPIPYPKCGEINPSAKVGVVNVPPSNVQMIPVTKWVEFEDNDSRNNYIADICFVKSQQDEHSEPKQQLVIQRLNRLQNHLDIVSVESLSDGEFQLSTLYSEDSDSWVDVNKPLRWLDLSKSENAPKGTKNNYFLLLSETKGWRQMFLVANSDSSEILEVTPDGIDVESICGYDEVSQVVYFIASPTDPIRRYLYSVSLSAFSSSTPSAEGLQFPVRRVTPDNDRFIGTNGYSLSQDGKFAVHTYCSAERPISTSIVSLPLHVPQCTLARNSRLTEMFQSLSLSDGGEDHLALPPIEFFKVPITADLEFDGWCMYPPQFDPSEVSSYPLIFYVYGEPAACTVRDRWAGKIGIWHRLLAQRGAVVISVDNRGTPSLKGSAWRKHIYKAIGKRPSEDQSKALSAILRNRPYINPERVAIWGWSGGGSMSLNMLFRYPEQYKTAVSVAPVPDMHLYDTIYQERYMATPQTNADGYHDGSPINFAKQMKEDQNLFVIHGTGDDNCHYQGVECLVNELILHNKQFRMFSYPNRSHSISEGQNTTRHLFDMITNFFKEKGLIT